MIAYLIWSFEHGRWWRPDGKGYTTEITEAGIYTLDHAEEICLEANRINEAIVPRPVTILRSMDTA